MESDTMETFIQTSILGVFTYVCAGDYEPMKKIGFALIIIGMIGSAIAYQSLKERIERIENELGKGKQHHINKGEAA